MYIHIHIKRIIYASSIFRKCIQKKKKFTEYDLFIFVKHIIFKWNELMKRIKYQKYLILLFQRYNLFIFASSLLVYQKELLINYNQCHNNSIVLHLCKL